jgi:hypothetical protein
MTSHSYYLDLFSPATWEAFRASARTVSGFQIRHWKTAQRIQPGDRLVCYLTKLSRWIGTLEVVDGPFKDETPLFYPENDPFIVRFHVRPIICLPVEHGVPIKEPELWDHLSFTAGYQAGTSAWATAVKGSLRSMTTTDAALIEGVLERQQAHPRVYPVDADEYAQLTARNIINRTDGPVSVSVPETPEESLIKTPVVDADETRESIKVQALLANIGSRMGMDIWLPKADRGAVLAHWSEPNESLLTKLPLNYDDVTLRTVERIDVLWLKGRSIRRAFEVEHTTSIYSGLLRMADLMALQPNMDITMHIVAPDTRREKVLEEIKRPVFTLLERGPLKEYCTFLSYSSVRELAAHPNLDYLSDKVIEQFEEPAEED